MSNTISRAEFSFRIYNKDLFIFSIPEKMNDASGKGEILQFETQKISVASYKWNRKKKNTKYRRFFKVDALYLVIEIKI